MPRWRSYERRCRRPQRSARCGWKSIDWASPSKKTVHADEQRRPDVAAARRRWRETQPLHDAAQYVFVDESGVTTDLLRRYARSPRGTRAADHTPCSHWQTHTVVAALRTTELGATAVFDGPIDNPRSASRSSRPVRTYDFCRPTVPISIPSSWHSPN